MINILNKIVAQKLKEVASLKERNSFSSYEKSRFFDQKTRSITEALNKTSFGIIAEIKRKSPSVGNIKESLNPCEMAERYLKSGMSAISILTDNDFFGGSNQDVIEVRKNVEIPILRKEFIVDEIQIFESKAIGADAILLIAEILTKRQIKDFTTCAKNVGLEVLMELHSLEEIDKIYDEIDILGVNNRNLKTQQTSVENSVLLMPYLPSSRVKISESGIKTREELEMLSKLGFQGALIGESILKSESVETFLANLKLQKYEN